jgi:hypothetical protein
LPPRCYCSASPLRCRPRIRADAALCLPDQPRHLVDNDPGGDPTSQRKKLIFHNPNDSAKIAVCPIGPPRVSSLGTANITAVINGAGCFTILPYGSFEVPGIVGAGPQLNLSSAWVGIASAGGSALTIVELL